MPRIKPEWEVSKEAQAIIENLCNLYPNKFGHIDPNTVGCVAITNKDRAESQDDSKIKGMREPESLFSSKSYIIAFYQKDWDEYDAGQRSRMIWKNLERIPVTDGGPDGSLLKLDLQDSKTLVRRDGVDYIKRKGLADLSAEKMAGMDVAPEETELETEAS